MTTATFPNPIQAFQRLNQPSGVMQLGAITRALVLLSGVTMTALCVFAIVRALLGLTGDLPHLTNAAVMFHVTTVIPCVPLGLYLLLARKGDAMHKALGKLWIALMVMTATSTLFIHEGMALSWIHIFVPLTYRASWIIVSSARKGDIKRHKAEIVSLFLTALMIPGIFAIALPGRLMNVMLMG
ncbi:hypothetical protein INR77_15715 [Erythrobacter sp. SCSIO 43205]|uniref:DUF2306 domain-containing protein n=1 Tax=Erythrobacter sp. SCSIO 43205 TaxID=2779361 RepID=UPI001CAA309D|nr:hypothetical protein [Erythrobacter sp. SCSIO 43205]UAB78166.1 hypothetical protein INR77_15715 [Erythrobacter sp. SCSIO 43205]